MGSLYYVDLLDLLRAAGCQVGENSITNGWQSRSRSSGGFDKAPLGCWWHHTASNTSPENDLNYMINGSPDKPVGNMLIDRNGVCWPIAAGASNCLAAGTPVLIRRGFVPIEDVQIGDEVWTHRNRWRPVIDRMAQAGDTVMLDVRGTAPVTCSADHPWLAWDGWKTGRGLERFRHGAADMVPAGNLARSHALLAPEHLPTESPPPIGGFAMSPQLAWFCGRWLADGHNEPWSVSLTVGQAKADHVCSWLDAAGLAWTRSPHGANAERIRIRNSTQLGRWLDRHFGRGAHGKTIPAWAFHRKIAEPMLEGYLHGDGWWNPRNETWVATTVSPCLSVGVMTLARFLGWSAAASTTTSPPSHLADGRTISASQRFDIKLRPRPGLYVDGRDIFPVRSVTPSNPRIVFDITVADDHSFVANGVICRNCAGKGGPTTFSRGVCPLDKGNTYGWQIECASDGVGGPWPEVQISAFFAASNALNARFGNQPDDVISHQSYAPSRKIDPATAAAVQGPWKPGSCTSSGSWAVPDIAAECLRRAGQPAPTPTPPTPIPQPPSEDWMANLPTIKKGDSGPYVKRMQHLLAAAGYMNEANTANYDGQWGSGTDGAKARFDNDHGLTPSPPTDCGDKSWKALMGG